MAGERQTGTAVTILKIDGVSKRFGGTQAVSDVGFSVSEGEIVALLGENGAGKSTLIKILAGVYGADTGQFSYRGMAFDPRQSHPNIAFIHQDLGLIDWMTVTENMCLMGNHYPRRGPLINWSQAREEALRALHTITDLIDPDCRVQDLTRTEKSLVAIARALARNANLLVLDEPTASLPQSDVEMLHGVLRRLKARGVAMIYVSHRLDEVFAIADRVVVLRDGMLVADQNIETLDGDLLIEQIIGRKFDDVFVRPPAPAHSADVLRLTDVWTEDVGPVSFSIKKGEVLGLVGLRGAGQDAIGHALFGRCEISQGQVTVNNTPLVTGHPLTIIKQGVAMVAGDRNAESMARGMTVQENLFLNPALTGRKLWDLQRRGQEQHACQEIGRVFDIRPNDPSAAVETLSGGNQQKVVMARWMQLGADVLILEDPTAGVDVGSKADIYALLSKSLERGLCILLISTDFEEVAALSHRALVFRDGEVAAELSGTELTVEHLLQTASLESSSLKEVA